MNEIIIYIMAVFAALGAADRMIGNRLGLGEKFEEGIKSIGPIALSMVGMLTLAPVIAKVMEPVVVPVFGLLGADPAMFVGCILANDMGGAPLAQSMAKSQEAANFAGLIVGSMLGATISFTIPASLEVVEKKDQSSLALGVLAGVITIPVGALAGGLTAGYAAGMLLRNLVPILLFVLVIALGLWKFQKRIIKAFVVFGKIIVAVISLGLGAGIVESLTGLVVIPGMNPVSEGFAVVAEIAVMLAGAFPLVCVITRIFRKPLLALGKMIGINEVAAAGMVTSLANSIPMFGMIKNMDARGKVVNMAFAVSAAFVFGDHLGFTAGFHADMIVPVIVGKLVGGIAAVLLALRLTGALSPDTDSVPPA